MSDNIVQLNTELIHSESKDLVKNSVEETLNAMLDAEADRLVTPSATHATRSGRATGPVITTGALQRLQERSICGCRS